MLWPNGLTTEPRLSGNESEADFGPRKTGKGFHDGVDYGNYFRLIRSIDAGVVVRIERWDGKPAGSTKTQHGNRVWVDHGNGVISSYSHLSRVDVELGERVDAGQALGTMGATGFVTGTHLHIEVRVWGKLVDPRPFIRARVGAPASGGSTPFEPPVPPKRRKRPMIHAAWQDGNGSIFVQPRPGAQITGISDISEWNGIAAATGAEFVKVNNDQMNALLARYGQLSAPQWDAQATGDGATILMPSDNKGDMYAVSNGVMWWISPEDLVRLRDQSAATLVVPRGVIEAFATRPPKSGAVDTEAISNAAEVGARAGAAGAIKDLTLKAQ